MDVELYFHGNIDRDVAECRLMLYSNKDGTFLIRCKDEANFVLSVFYKRKIAHYLILKESDSVFVWDAKHHYDSLENVIEHHSQNNDGMITTLTVGCPVRYFIIQDSLFPNHQCNGLCWFHSDLTTEEIRLRLAVIEPQSGSFLITNGNVSGSHHGKSSNHGNFVLYVLSIWLSGNVVHHRVMEKGSLIFITPDLCFPNLLDLIRHYLTDPALGHVLTRPCCVTTWYQRGHISHPPQILTSMRHTAQSEEEEEEVEEDGAPVIQRKLAVRDRNRNGQCFNSLNLANLSNLSLSDTDCGRDEEDGDDGSRSAVGFFNITYNSDEEPARCNTKDARGATLELHNTLSRKGSRRIKRKSLEKTQRLQQKIQASKSDQRSTSSDDEILIDSPMSEGGEKIVSVNASKLKRRNAKEKKRNKKCSYLVQAEIDNLKCSHNRLTLNPNDILFTEHIGSGVHSKVYKGTLHQIPVSIKKVNKNSSNWVNDIVSLEHDNLLRLIGFEKERLIVTELCELGSLDGFLLKNDRKVTSPLNVLTWMRDICSALLHLDGIGIQLRALSCRNILLNNGLCAKLSSYSTSRVFNDQDDHKIRWLPTDNKHCLVWSYGITLLEAIHYAQFKYTDLMDIKYNNGTPIISFQSHVPVAIRNLVKSCIRKRHSDRPKLKTVKEKLDVILDIIIKAYNWRVKDPKSLLSSLNLEKGGISDKALLS